MPENSQSQEKGSESKKADETAMTGIVNRIGNPLVILDEKDQYLKFDVEGISLDGIEEGDKVEVKYIGTLSEDSDDLVASAVTKK